MALWNVMGEGPHEVVAIVESLPEGRVSILVQRNPLTATKAQELRWAIGAAIGDSQTPGTPTGNNEPTQDQAGHSRGGETDA